MVFAKLPIQEQEKWVNRLLENNPQSLDSHYSVNDIKEHKFNLKSKILIANDYKSDDIGRIEAIADSEDKLWEICESQWIPISKEDSYDFYCATHPIEIIELDFTFEDLINAFNTIQELAADREK